MLTTPYSLNNYNFSLKITNIWTKFSEYASGLQAYLRGGGAGGGGKETDWQSSQKKEEKKKTIE